MSSSVIARLSLAVLLLSVAACATPEEQLRADMGKFRAVPEGDHVAMCGQIGEVMLERGEILRHNAVSATVGGGEILGRTPNVVSAQAWLHASATGYRSGQITFQCGFETKADDLGWHEVISLAVEGRRYDKASLGNINALGRTALAETSVGAATSRK